MESVLLFAGTTEGRLLSEELCKQGIAVTASVVSGYGKELMQPGEGLRILEGAKNGAEIADLIREGNFSCVIDATHPYAREISAALRRICGQEGKLLLRVVREEGPQQQDALYFDTPEEAAAYLRGRRGNVLLTVGSKELPAFLEIDHWQERLYVRVLPAVESLEKCREAGVRPQNVIAMQGPFSWEMNLALLHHCKARWMVTKDSGEAGGFPEKLEAAREAGAVPLILRRPRETGMPWQEVLARVLDSCGKKGGEKR